MLKEGSLFKKMIGNITLNITFCFIILLIVTPNIYFNSPNDVISVYKYWFIASFLMGVFNIVYEFEKLSTLSATIIHFSSTVFFIFITSIITAKYYPKFNINNQTMVLQAVCIAFVIFAVVWVMYYLIEKREASKINSKL